MNPDDMQDKLDSDENIERKCAMAEKFLAFSKDKNNDDLLYVVSSWICQNAIERNLLWGDVQKMMGTHFRELEAVMKGEEKVVDQENNLLQRFMELTAEYSNTSICQAVVSWLMCHVVANNISWEEVVKQLKPIYYSSISINNKIIKDFNYPDQI